MVTIKEIADKLGLSPATVSKGLHDADDISAATRHLVLKTAAEMGYRTKKSQKKDHRKVCILVEHMDYESIDQFGYSIISGFEQAAAAQNFQVQVISANLNTKSSGDYDTYMLKNGYSGAFLLGFNLHDDYIRQLDHTTTPTVLLDNFIPGNPHVGYVGTDNSEGMKYVITHLKELGHTRIAFLNGTKNSMVTQKRLDSFYQSMAENHLPVISSCVAFGDFHQNQAGQFLPGFLKENISAIVCASDRIASGVVNELYRMGLQVPADISVTGYDDIPLASYMTPPLTTVRQDRAALGKSAFFLLDALMQNISISRIELRPELIIRNSSQKLHK